MNTASTLGLGHLPSNTIANPKGKLKAITTRSGIVLDGPFVPMPPPFINPEEDERVEETLTDQDLAKYTIKEKLLELANTPLNENCSAVILKKLPEKLGDPRKFLILYGFSELKYKAVANLDLHPPHNVNPLSGSTTSSSPNHFLEEFANELTLITFPLENDDLPFDIESNLKEIDYLLNHDPIKKMDSILKDLIDQSNLADLNDNLVDTIPEMFTDEHTLDYSSSSLYNDDFPHSSKYDSFLFEDFFKVDALPLTNNEDNVFNPGILIRENLFEVITRVVPDKNIKKLAISHASLILKDFDPPLYELLFFKEVLGSKTLLSLSSENEEKVFKLGIVTSKGVHSSLIPELSHRGYKVFKIIKIIKSPVEIFLFSYGEDIRILDVPCPYFYPP
nr:reverse transcriptase domain-containing protein [Tanacetum cinerariifolium]